MTDIRYWNELDRGGHFAAFEQPQLFVNELRSFFRLVFFSPSLVGLVFVAMIFSTVLEKHTGLLNVLLHRFLRQCIHHCCLTQQLVYVPSQA